MKFSCSICYLVLLGFISTGCISANSVKPLPYKLKNGITIESWEPAFGNSNIVNIVIHYRTPIGHHQSQQLRDGEIFFGYRINNSNFETKTIGTPKTGLAGIIVSQTSLDSGAESLTLEDASGYQRILIKQ